MPIEKAIEAFKNGQFVIVFDHHERENEGDLFLPAEDITAKKLNFLLTYGKGLICVPMKPKRLEELHLPLMIPEEQNCEYTGCQFAITIDAKDNQGSGISAEERANTIRKLADPASTKDDFVRPGHIFPLKANENGLKARDGHTEAALELCKLAGKREVAVLCEILNPDGTVARLPQLKEIGEKHNIPVISVDELKEYLEI